MIYASNQVGFSLTEYLITKTEGSGRILLNKNFFYKLEDFSSVVN